MKSIMVNKTFDDIGVYAEPIPPNAKRYNFRKMLSYCDEHDKTVAELSEEEKEQFAI